MPRDTALITGASSGIGAFYADRLARRGHDLVLVARDQARLDALAERLRRETGVAVEVLAADLADPAQLTVVERRLAEDGAIGMLINNAGIAGGGPIASGDVARYDAMVRLNVLAPTRLAAAIAPRLARRGSGTIVNLASIVALMPGGGLGATYVASKSYMLLFSEALAAELAPRGVRVQAVLPGATRTEIWERAGLDLDAFPPERVMAVEDLVDAALTGLDLGEAVTIPSLPDPARWDAYLGARTAMTPDLSHRVPAARYRQSVAAD